MKDDRFPRPGTGESITTPGEERAKRHPEPGHVELEPDDTGRPAGGSTARMQTSIDPQDPVNTETPNTSR